MRNPPAYLVSAAASALAEVDVAAAKAALRSLRPEIRSSGEGAIRRVLRRSDPGAALAYARESGRDELEAYMPEYMAERDPRAAAAEMKPGKRFHGDAVKAIAEGLLESDRPAFEAWVEGLEDPKQRAMARAADFEKDAAGDPRRAAALTAEWFTGDPEAAAESAELAGHVVRKWIAAEEKAAGPAAWAAGLPEGAVRDRAVVRAAEEWAMADAAAASAWIETLPGGAARDEAVMSLVNQIYEDTPEDALAWARSISTEHASHRGEALQSAVEGLAERDFSAAAAAVEALRAEDQPALRERLREIQKEKAEEKGEEE